MIEVVLQDEVLQSLRTLPPEPKKIIKQAIRELAQEKGDILPLTNELDGFHRLRIGRYRIILRYEWADGHQRAVCISLGQRRWIYEVFQEKLAGER